MKITKEKIDKLLHQFNVDSDYNIPGVVRCDLAKFLTEELKLTQISPETLDERLIAERKCIEENIACLTPRLTDLKEKLKKLQDSCPHTDRKTISEYDGLVFSTCQICHASVTRYED